MPAQQPFWDAIAQKYASQPIKDPTAYDQTIDRVRAHLRPGDRVLELGGGTGTTALRLAPHVAHVTMSDGSAAMVAIARDKVRAEGVTNVECVVADALDSRWHERSFDVVAAFNLLHLVADVEAVVERIRDIVGPGGLFVSKTVCLGGPYQLLRPILWVMRALGKAPAVRFLSIAEWERIVRDAGFEILEADNLPARPPSRFLVARCR